jgi:hypothetical protein
MPPFISSTHCGLHLPKVLAGYKASSHKNEFPRISSFAFKSMQGGQVLQQGGVLFFGA